MKWAILFACIYILVSCKKYDHPQLRQNYEVLDNFLKQNTATAKLISMARSYMYTDSVTACQNQLKKVQATLKNEENYIGMYAVGFHTSFYTNQFKNWTFTGNKNKEGLLTYDRVFMYGTLYLNGTKVPNVICIAHRVPYYYNFRVYYFFKANRQYNIQSNNTLNITQWLQENGFNQVYLAN